MPAHSDRRPHPAITEAAQALGDGRVRLLIEREAGREEPSDEHERRRHEGEIVVVVPRAGEGASRTPPGC